MTEAVYLDIDGTLRDELEGVPDSAARAVLECRARGIRVLICTGRNRGSIQDDVLALEPDGIISSGGCRIELGGVCVWERAFSRRIPEILADAGGLAVALESERDIYMNRLAAEFYREDVRRKTAGLSGEQRRRLELENKIRYEENLEEFNSGRDRIYKACLAGEKGAVAGMERRLLGEARAVQRREWNGRWYLELLPAGCGKGSAIAWCNRRMGITRENCLAFGDGENDLDMRTAAGSFVAVAGAAEAVRRRADAVCEAVTEDGIYRELARRGVIGERSAGMV